MKKLIRHEIDPILVEKTINEKIQDYEDCKIKRNIEHKALLAEYAEDMKNGNTKERWTKAPEPDGKIEEIYNDWIKTEKTHYAKVRVIEDPNQKGNRFYLVYGKDKDEAKGTGPFESIDRATDWFLKQGR
jgi:hypothetical protein